LFLFVSLSQLHSPLLGFIIKHRKPSLITFSLGAHFMGRDPRAGKEYLSVLRCGPAWLQAG
jgi:hypothetical protein